MGKFDMYKVDLKGMWDDIRQYEYLLDNHFFANIGSEDIQKGRIRVELTVTKRADAFEFAFRLQGTVVIPCDRCLDDMNYPLDTTARLIVKFGKDYAEESDEIVTIPETEGSINLAWFLYEFVALAIPVKHVHMPGKCNKQMSAKLKKYTAKTDDDDHPFEMDDTGDILIPDDAADDDTPDPRWDALKDLEIN